MNKFVIGALALSAGPAVAGTSDEWLGLDQEINSLSTAVAPQGPTLQMGALVRSSWANYDKDISFTTQSGGTPEADNGWAFQDLDVWLQDSIGDFDWRVSLDLSGNGTEGGLYYVGADAGILPGGYSGPSEGLDLDTRAYGFFTGQRLGQGDFYLEDAYGEFHFSPSVHLRWGQYKFPFSLSNQVDSGAMLMINQTIIGGLFYGWELGAMLHGSFSQFYWALGIQNGVDSIAKEYRFSGRAEFQGNGGAGGAGEFRQGGALGAVSGLAYTVGIAYTDDDGFTDGTGGSLSTGIFLIDAAATWDNFSGLVEWSQFDKDLVNGTDKSSPFSLTLGWLINPNWEVAVRYEDMDKWDITKFGAGVNWYMPDHRSKWQLNLSNLELGTGSTKDKGTIIEIGLALGATH